MCSFQACSHLYEPSAPVTVLRSVSGTPDPCQFGSDGCRGAMLLDKQGGSGGGRGGGHSVRTMKQRCDEFGDYYHNITALFVNRQQ